MEEAFRARVVCGLKVEFGHTVRAWHRKAEFGVDLGTY